MMPLPAVSPAPSASSPFDRRFRLRPARLAVLAVLAAAWHLGGCEGLGIMGGLPPETDGDADADGDTDADAGVCGGECVAGARTACTCAASDPCGWAGNGVCDDACGAVTASRFDDSADCAVGPACDGACDRGHYDSCTCAASDPCGWVRDGYCDDACAGVLPGAWFDDTEDCAGPPPVCGGDCDARRYTSCSCGADDPCGWAANGVCDDACAGVTASPFDDRADCGEPPGELTFSVSAVRDDLDQNDLVLTANSLRDIGYAEQGRNTNVTTSALASLLRQQVTVHYHTGHGTEGLVMTADGALHIGTTAISARNTIWATCLTLAESWTSAFGATAETVLGYTMVSYDFIDDDVARNYVSSLGAGRSHIEAWYLANAGIGMLSDRWAGYVREGGSIVEYSARSGRRPVAASTTEWVALDGAGGLRMSADLLGDERTFEEGFATVRVVAAPEPTADVVMDAFSRLSEVTFSEPEAALVAERGLAAAHGGVPEDAVLDRVVAVESRTGPLDPTVRVGYVVRFGREVAGLRVAGNGTADHIAVLVGREGALAVSWYWPELEAAATPRPGGLLPVGRAAALAADSISRALKGGELDLLDAVPVHGTLGPSAGPGELVPAYELRAPGGESVVVSAVTGELLR